MPTPIEIFTDPLSLFLMALYASMMLWEALFPARELPRVPLWPLRGLTAFVVFFLLSSWLPLWVDGLLAQWQLFDISELGTGLQFAIGLLVFEFVLYCWHRSLHHFDFLWQGFHQMHHSAERLDTFGAFWLSPLDMMGFTMVGSIALVLLVGVSAEVAMLILVVTFFFSVFQHMNVNTPHWLGYLVQRPESHSHHHGRGVHRNNYADVPWFDILFGTFTNPRERSETGFYQGASSRVAEMLLCRDVYQETGGSQAAAAEETTLA